MPVRRAQLEAPERCGPRRVPGVRLCARSVCGGALIRRLAAVVQELRSGIEAVRPDNGAGLRINADLAEVLEVSQGFAERAALPPRAQGASGSSASYEICAYGVPLTRLNTYFPERPI